TVYSLHLPYWFNAFVVFVITLPLSAQSLWSVMLEPNLSRSVQRASLLTSLVVAEMAFVVSFLPATVWIAALFLASIAYVLIGLLQHALYGRLFERTFWEYITVGVFVLMATLVVMPWR
ncbi:MAG: hypothetical protein CUN55_18990, partial [Phototrophicales bacterium]